MQIIKSDFKLSLFLTENFLIKLLHPQNAALLRDK